jgi:hypothetical protein
MMSEMKNWKMRITNASICVFNLRPSHLRELFFGIFLADLRRFFFLRSSALSICAYLRELFSDLFLSPIYADIFSAPPCIEPLYSSE